MDVRLRSLKEACDSLNYLANIDVQHTTGRHLHGAFG